MCPKLLNKGTSVYDTYGLCGQREQIDGNGKEEESTFILHLKVTWKETHNKYIPFL